MKRSYAELKARSQRRVAQKLRKAIAGHDGSARSMRDILRGLAAAGDLEMDTTPFTRELSKRLVSLGSTDEPRRRVAG